MSVSSEKNKMEFFQKHIIEGTNVSQCAREMKLDRSTLHSYKSSDDFRELAIQYLEGDNQKGISTAMERLTTMLKAKRSVVITDSEGNETTKLVEDNKSQMDAIKEFNKIYGTYASAKIDVTTTISMSSDADIFKQIDEAQRRCKHVTSHEVRYGSEELAKGELGVGEGSHSSRKRTLLHNDSLQE